MFSFTNSPVAVRSDLTETFVGMWAYFAKPGPVFDASQRSALLKTARTNENPDSQPGDRLPEHVAELAHTLYHDPAQVDNNLVRTAAGVAGDAATVETIGLVSMLSAVDGVHRALGVDLEPLPRPIPGSPTGNIIKRLKRRRTYVPMPRGAIPSALDLVPDVASAWVASFGPLYMTDEQMGYVDFVRSPGLDRAQIELIAAKTSLINECFY